MATTIESPIKEKYSYYILRHKATGLYVHELDSASRAYDLDATRLLDDVDDHFICGPMRIYPCVGGRAVSALEIPPGTESEVARLLDQDARRVIDWLNQNDHYMAGDVRKGDYKYSDFELFLVEVQYSVKDTQPVAENA